VLRILSCQNFVVAQTEGQKRSSVGAALLDHKSEGATFAAFLKTPVADLDTRGEHRWRAVTMKPAVVAADVGLVIIADSLEHCILELEVQLLVARWDRLAGRKACDLLRRAAGG